MQSHLNPCCHNNYIAIGICCSLLQILRYRTFLLIQIHCPECGKTGARYKDYHAAVSAFLQPEKLE